MSEKGRVTHTDEIVQSVRYDRPYSLVAITANTAAAPHAYELAARQFYSARSIVDRMRRSKTGLWWNVTRNIGYHLALRNYGSVGYDPAAVASQTSAIVPQVRLAQTGDSLLPT